MKVEAVGGWGRGMVGGGGGGGRRKREREEVNLGLKMAEKSKGIGNKS